ncbi:glycosyl hydrolase 115 family protein [Chitinophaga cymbidii]|uniref:Uncharacterized protein n=1 Tax=Chitinophaga cymbidii TaxID=1096750 RepID=A0A512RLM8_9BACT|nr:glycosyl hydrolase 115 family protein [Chitinophaga cymbidii]GEP96596.1 hypothetical protein CCY01nite_28560 [Chitinophaga cymbidii]
MLRRAWTFFLFLGLLWCNASCMKAAAITLHGNTPIYTSAKPGEPLYKAVLALQRDMEKILGGQHTIRPLTEMDRAGIVVLNSLTDSLLAPLAGWEAHRLYTATVAQHPQVILQGADMRGTIYAIYTFSERVLGVPPLWYFSGWQPAARNDIRVPASFSVNCPSPSVKYRAWFPNDTDLFAPWRKASRDNSELWLETALRLKLNTIEWFDGERDYGKPYSISPTTRLISDYGLLNTTHHHSPLNATFSGWNDYWRKTRDTVPPELSLANEKYLEEFWRYNVECIVRNKIPMLWVIGFRGNGDHPFWFTFNDAPSSMKERGAVISRMMARQREIVLEVTGDPATQFRTIFYDELSDLLAEGYIHPPADTSFIWTYVAARRDHYPNEDIRQLDKSRNFHLGYYFNYQFTSTGSHLAAGEGPWKMEKNYRYVAGKTNRPLAFSVVNAGNLREFVMELSANAAMMWDFSSYRSDAFLEDFCRQYFGKRHAPKAARLYKAYYHAYWNQRRPELEGFDRQFVFQDLRYRRAIFELAKAFNNDFDPNPLTDIPAEQVKGRTYRIIPEDNNAATQVDAVITGTTKSAAAFRAVANAADVLYRRMDADKRMFFSDNLRQPAQYMYYLNESLLLLCKAYKSHDAALVEQSVAALQHAEKALHVTAHGRFLDWYDGDRVFGFKGLYKALGSIRAGKTP